MNRPTIKTSRCILRPLRPQDYQAWYGAYACGNPSRNRWDRGKLSAEICGKKDFSKVQKRHERLAKLDHTYVWAAFRKSDGVMIGTIDFFIICRDVLQKANLGYRVFNKHWGHGYGKEMVAAGVKLAFKALKLQRLEAGIDRGNKRSRSLAKSVGLKFESNRRKYFFDKGKWEDNLIYVAIREDWGFKPLKPVIKRP